MGAVLFLGPIHEGITAPARFSETMLVSSPQPILYASPVCFVVAAKKLASTISSTWTEIPSLRAVAVNGAGDEAADERVDTARETAARLANRDTRYCRP